MIGSLAIAGWLHDRGSPLLQFEIAAINLRGRYPKRQLHRGHARWWSRPVLILHVIIASSPSAQREQIGSHTELYPIAKIAIKRKTEDITIKTLHRLNILADDNGIIKVANS